MPSRHYFAAVFVLLLTAVSAYLFFSPTPVIVLFGSAWLPGFLMSLVSVILGMLLLFPHRSQAVFYKITIWASWGILLLYLLLLTPFAVILFGP